MPQTLRGKSVTVTGLVTSNVATLIVTGGTIPARGAFWIEVVTTSDGADAITISLVGSTDGATAGPGATWTTVIAGNAGACNALPMYGIGWIAVATDTAPIPWPSPYVVVKAAAANLATPNLTCVVTPIFGFPV